MGKGALVVEPTLSKELPIPAELSLFLHLVLFHKVAPLLFWCKLLLWSLACCHFKILLSFWIPLLRGVLLLEGGRSWLKLLPNSWILLVTLVSRWCLMWFLVIVFSGLRWRIRVVLFSWVFPWSFAWLTTPTLWNRDLQQILIVWPDECWGREVHCIFRIRVFLLVKRSALTKYSIWFLSLASELCLLPLHSLIVHCSYLVPIIVCEVFGANFSSNGSRGVHLRGVVWTIIGLNRRIVLVVLIGILRILAIRVIEDLRIALVWVVARVACINVLNGWLAMYLHLSLSLITDWLFKCYKYNYLLLIKS